MLAGVLDDVLDLVLPRSCLGCARAGSALCSRCSSPDPQVVALPDLYVVAGGNYDGALRAALLAYKERGRRDLARPLAALLAQAVHEVCASRESGLVLVPVPSTRGARRARGGDHVVRLARNASVAPVRPALRFVRAVRDSAGLDIADRSANLHGALRATRPPSGQCRAVLVDDIVTTGATLRECARALAAAQWQVRGGAVVAATPRRYPRGMQ